MRRPPSPRKRQGGNKAGPPAAHTLLAEALGERWERFRREVTRSRKRATERSIHDLRVSIRRLVAALDMAAAILPPDLLRPARRRLKRHLRAFAELRDVQVQHLSVSGMVREFPVLRRYRSWLVSRERALVAQGRAECRRISVTDLETEILALAREFSGLFAEPVAQRIGDAAAGGAMATAFARAIRLYGALRAEDPSSIHRLRVAFKKCRYSVEILAPVLQGTGARTLKRMHAYQTRMGEIQDNEVLIAGIRAYARRLGGPASTSFIGVLQELSHRRRLMTAQFVAQADVLKDFWHTPQSPGDASPQTGTEIEQ